MPDKGGGEPLYTEIHHHYGRRTKEGCREGSLLLLYGEEHTGGNKEMDRRCSIVDKKEDIIMY